MILLFVLQLLAAEIGIWWQVIFLFIAMGFLFYPDLVNSLLGSLESYRLDDDLSLPLFLLAVVGHTATAPAGPRGESHQKDMHRSLEWP